MQEEKFAEFCEFMENEFARLQKLSDEEKKTLRKRIFVEEDFAPLRQMESPRKLKDFKRRCFRY